MRIIFAGTPEFAAVALQKLLESSHQICMVYTQPDRPAGRGQKIQESAVKQLAKQHHLPLRQPHTLRDKIEQQFLHDLKADLMVVAAYGLILPSTVLTAPRLGCINIHASLLPRWRGAAPIQHAILAGDQETGITIMQMDQGLDTGPMLYKVATLITATDTSQTLHDRLALLGGEALLKTMADLEHDLITPIPQDNNQTCHAPKITKEQAHLDWKLSSIQLDRMVRAFNPWPVAFSHLNETTLRIWTAQSLTQPVTMQPGTLLNLQKEGIDVACGDGILRLTTLQLPGGKPLPVSAILNAKHALFVPGIQFH